MIDPRKFNEWMKFQAEYTAMLKPEIKAEYDKLVAATQEWDKRRNYDQLRSSLEQDKNQHVTNVKEWEAERDKYTSDMQAWHSVLNKREEAVKKKEADLAAQKSDLIAAQSAHESNVKMHKAAVDAKSKEFDKKQADLDALQKVLHDREVDLSAKHSKVQSAITSLKSLQ